MAVKVVACGADGFTGRCDLGKHHKLPWDAVLGHKARLIQQYRVADQGADGAILEAPDGHRRYLAGTAAANPDGEENKVLRASKGEDDPLLGGMTRLRKAVPSLILMKAKVANRPGLALKDVTDKAGHRTKRWSRTAKDAPAAHGAPLEHGQTVAFRHGDVGGEGKIVGSGADGVTLQDKDGQQHQVRHEHLVTPGSAGSGHERVGRNMSREQPLPEAEQKAKRAAFNEKQAATGQPAFGDAPDFAARSRERDAATSGDARAAAAGGAAGGGGAEPPDGGAEPAPLFSAEDMALPQDASQPTKNPDDLFAKSAEGLEQMRAWLNKGSGICDSLGMQTMTTSTSKVDWAEAEKDPKGMLFLAPLKARDRSADKVKDEYGGDWSKLLDTVRCTIAVNSHAEVVDLIAKLKAGGLKLARRPKDRFRSPLDGGYRDCLMNVTLPNGLIGEVQLHIKGFLAAKGEGHRHYDVARSIAPKLKKGTATPDEKQAYADAMAKQEEIYGAAWKKVSGDAKSDTGDE